MPNPFSKFFSSFRNASQQAQQGQQQAQQQYGNVPLQIKAFLSTLDDVDQQVSELHGMIFWLQNHTNRDTDESHVMTLVRSFRKFSAVYFRNVANIRAANNMDQPHQQPIDQGGFDHLRQMLGYINDKLQDMHEEFPFFANYANVAKNEQEKQAAMEIYKAWSEFFKTAQAELIRYEESNPLTGRVSRKREPKDMVDSQSPTVRDPNDRQQDSHYRPYNQGWGQ